MKIDSTINDIAKQHRVTPRTIRRWMSSGLIPYYRYSSRCIRFQEEEVRNALAKLRIPARRERCRGASP